MPEDVALESSASESSSSDVQATQNPSDSFGESAAQNGKFPDKATTPTNGSEPKHLSRYERTKHDKAAFKAAQAQFAAEREAFARERAQFEEAKKPRRDYTIADLKKYSKQWEQEGNYDLVDKANREIEVMQAEEQAMWAARTVDMPPLGTPEHLAQWQQAEYELAQVDPEFMRAGTRLDTKLREIMGSSDGNIYRQHPRGIVAAYHRACLELARADLVAERTKSSKYQQELQRLTGLTSIDGGAISQLGNGSRIESLDDFSRLSTKDMKKHLMRTAKRGSTPWF